MQFHIRDLFWLFLIVSILCIRGLNYRSGYDQCAADLDVAIKDAWNDGNKTIVIGSPEAEAAINKNPLLMRDVMGNKRSYVLYTSRTHEDTGREFIVGYFWPNRYKQTITVVYWFVGCGVPSLVLLLLWHRLKAWEW